VNAAARLDRLPIAPFHWRVLWLIAAPYGVLVLFNLYGVTGVVGSVAGLYLIVAVAVTLFGRPGASPLDPNQGGALIIRYFLGCASSHQMISKLN
jgi:hypothetical protein